MNAYWITPQAKVIEVKKLHIDEIIKKPEVFGETKKSLQDTFDKYSENYGIEGKARNDILIRIIKRGYIRIRQRRNDWSIQLFQMNRKTSDILWQWARLIYKEVKDKYADISIHTLKDNKMIKSSFNKISENEDWYTPRKMNFKLFLEFYEPFDRQTLTMLSLNDL